MELNRILQTGNIIAYILMIAVNYLSNRGFFNDTTIADVSAKYQNLFTPAGYAFSIWGVIYLGLLGFVIYQARGLWSKSKNGRVAGEISWWFIVSCLANISWIIAFVNDYIGFSVILMLILLFSLIRIFLRTGMELDDVPFRRIAFVWWPFSFYGGWITVALIANVAAWLQKIGWDGWGLSEVTWTLIMIAIVGSINVVITWTRNMREFAMVGAWGLIAVAVANWGKEETIAYAAIGVGGTLLLNSALHAYRNRRYLPW